MVNGYRKSSLDSLLQDSNRHSPVDFSVKEFSCTYPHKSYKEETFKIAN